MNYKPILKRKVYSTWVSEKRLHGCKIFIKQTPNGEYYFYEITCYDGSQISSLGLVNDSEARFKEFDLACRAAENWVKKNCI